MITEEIEQLIYVAKQFAKSNLNPKYTAAHLLKALLNPQFDFLKNLDSKGVDVFYLDEWAEVRISQLPKNSKPVDEPQADQSAIIVLEEANDYAQKRDIPVSYEVILVILVTPGIGFTHDQLKSLGFTPQQMENLLFSDNNQNQNSLPLANNNTIVPKNNTSILEKYCVNRISQNNTSKQIIGRENDLKTITEIINRKLKPHVLVIGEPGVGKSTLIEAFCNAVSNKSSLKAFHNASIYEVKLGNLFAGASYKGEIEDRLTKVFEQLKKFENPILIIDDIHELFDSGQSNISSVIKSELSQSIITFIGITTVEKHRKTVGKDDAIARRFEILEIEEPTQDTAFKMIHSIIDDYEKHHNLTIDEDSIKEAIRVSKRYLKEKSLPDSAIDLIDRTMSTLKVAKEAMKVEKPVLSAQLEAITNPTEENSEELDIIHSKIISILGKVFEIGDSTSKTYDALPNAQEKKNHLDHLLVKLNELEEQEDKIDKSHLTSVVSAITGIPAGKVKSDEREKLLDIENTLKRRVIGQDYAVKIVSDSILESRSGLTKPGQPIGSFFFLGPTGTGKTELAKSMADFLFGDETAIIRFDMSEFKEEHSAALLYGAPPGYVGYEEGGLLVNKIRQKPYSIVLFDEIEKAHKSVFDVFLQILDEGKLHDRLGKEGDFSNSVILFTSNIGSDFIVKSFESGEIPKSNDLIKIMANYFRPEFLGRLTEIVPFAPIAAENVARIFDIHLKKELLELLEKIEISLEIDAENKQKIALLGFSSEYGARPIKGNIRNYLKRPLSRMIISNEIMKGDTITAVIDDNNDIQFTKI